MEYANKGAVLKKAIRGGQLYNKRVLEDEYDVTALVKNGENQLVIRLGNGWWNPLPMGMFKGLVNLRKILPHGTPTAQKWKVGRK